MPVFTPTGKSKQTAAYVLGAGFSCAFNPELAPVQSNFLELAKRRGSYQPADKHNRLTKLVSRHFGVPTKPDIETLATFLTTEWTGETASQKVNRQAAYSELLEIIEDTLDQIHKYPKSEEVNGLYSRFAEKLIADCSRVVTFNYDLLIEEFLFQTGKWHPYDGYGFEMLSSQHRVSGLDPSCAVVYKLHGSLSWGTRNVPYVDGTLPVEVSLTHSGKKEIGSIKRMSLTGSFRVFPEGQRQVVGPTYYYDVFLVPPLAVKESMYSHPLVRNTWYCAEMLLRETDKIIIIGYSFPRTDLFAEFMFRRAHMLSSAEQSIVVVNRSISEEYKQRVQGIFQKAKLEFIEKDAIDFVREIM